MELGLKGKRAAIAGSSRGMGLAIARAFRAEGADVWLSGRSDADLKTASSSLGNCKFTVCDLESESGRDTLFREVQGTWGKLDCLVLNVGSGRSSQNGLDASAAEWTRVWNLNFLSHADLVTKFAKSFSPAASIVSISSIVGETRLPAPSAYAAAKAALNNYCLYTASQLAESGVRYNVVAPGNVFAKGGRWEELLAADKSKVEKYINESVPMKRFATPEEIANAVLFLASSAASFCTGSVLRVDGGQSGSV